MPIIVGIDGTFANERFWENRDKNYDAAFANSFVRKIAFQKNNAQYSRGPMSLGHGLLAAINNGKSFIETKRREMGADEPILLTGFSRGGLGVLVIARDLQKQNIPVQAMMLFDAIDMYLYFNVEKVPTNVRNVFHARSHVDAQSRQNWRKKDCGGNPHSPQVNYTEQAFRCTHGAMGGTAQTDAKKPNDFISEFGSGTTKVTNRDNPIISRQVWMAAQPFLKTHNFV